MKAGEPVTSDEVVGRVARSARYRRVDPALVRRLAEEEGRHGGGPDAIAKRVKRRLHQAVGAFGETRKGDRLLARLRSAWEGTLDAPPFRDSCREALASHASTRERVRHLDAFYAGIWSALGRAPGSVLDLGSGLAPLALPWMDLARSADYHACDADAGTVAVIDAFLTLVGQPGDATACDLVAAPPLPVVDVAFLLKLVPTLDRQDPRAAARVVGSLRASAAVVSFPRRSLGGRGKGMERTYRERIERLAGEVPRVRGVSEASVPNELVFVLELQRG